MLGNSLDARSLTKEQHIGPRRALTQSPEKWLLLGPGLSLVINPKTNPYE
jgi:hypothetical protein